MKTSTVLVTGAASVLVLGCAYALYFDHKRRNDVEFRKSLRRERKRAQKAEKEKEAAASNEMRERVGDLVRMAKEEGFPTDVEEKEAFFMEQVAAGEMLCQDPAADRAVEAALCFYKALKVYPQPKDLINIYDKTVPKHVLNILADMIVRDGAIPLDGAAPTGGDHVE